MGKSLLALLSFLVFGFSAKAEWNPTFGPEFNFTTEKMIEEEEKDPNQIRTLSNVRAQKKMFRIAKRKCPECRVEIGVNMYSSRTYRLYLPEGWWIEFDLDPAVVEVKTSPMTLSEIQKYQPVLQRLVFDTAKEIDLKVRDH